MKTMIPAVMMAAMLSTAAHAATLVTNGDFETVDGRLGVTTGDSDGNALNSLASGTNGGSWDVFADLPGGWYSSVGAGIEVQTTNTLGNVDAHSGKHYIELDSEAGGQIGSNSDLRQNLGALKKGSYELSFWYRPRTGQGATDGILVEILGAGLNWNVVNTDTSKWVNIVFPFMIGGGNLQQTLRFAATGNADELGGFIDTVSLTGSPAPVPLPAPALLLAAGLASLAALRRRA